MKSTARPKSSLRPAPTRARAEKLCVIETISRARATPANWQDGDDVIILPAVSDEEARTTYPDGWKQPLPYMRIVPQPK